MFRVQPSASREGLCVWVSHTSLRSPGGTCFLNDTFGTAELLGDTVVLVMMKSW